MGDAANADDARKCLDIAHAALQAGDTDKAARFAEKAMKLYPHDEARKLLRVIKSKAGVSTSGAVPNGSAGGSGADSGPSLRRRAPPAAAAGGQAQQRRPEAGREDRSTPEQRELVASILRKRDFYEVLGLARGCSEDDLKRAYKKLALRLHPDKNTAPRSDEAFKAVSKAFSCLSDANKRATYDRYGEEAPGPSGRGGGGGGPFGGGGGGFDDIDPNEIFNMFFGGGFPSNRNAHIFRTFGGGFPPGARQPRGEPPSLGVQLAQLLPILFMLLLTFFAMRPSQPVFSLDRAGDFARQLDTQRFNVPFFVKPGPEFERGYPRGSHARARVEAEAEAGYKERLDRQCYAERLHQQRMFRWGQAAKARQQPMPACQEIVDRFGSQHAYQQAVYGY